MKQAERRSRARYWQAQVTAWERSGLTQREYCKRQGLSEWSLSCWKRRLAGRANDGVKFLPVAVAQPIKEKTATAGNGSPLTLVVGSRYRVEVGEGFSDETLTRLLTVLRGR